MTQQYPNNARYRLTSKRSLNNTERTNNVTKLGQITTIGVINNTNSYTDYHFNLLVFPCGWLLFDDCHVCPVLKTLRFPHFDSSLSSSCPVLTTGNSPCIPWKTGPPVLFAVKASRVSIPLSLIVFDDFSLIVFDSRVSIPILGALSFLDIVNAIEVRHYMMLGFAIMMMEVRHFNDQQLPSVRPVLKEMKDRKRKIG